VGPPDDGGSGGESGEDDSAVRLQGDVRVLDSIAALEASTWPDSVELLVEGRSQDVMGRWNGSDPFLLDGVKRGPTIWAQASPGPGDALRTLQPIDTTVANPSGVVETSLTIVRASELDVAFSVLALPITRDEARAQLVVVALSQGRAAAGVSVRADAADVVIYVDNGGFTDTATSTDGSGIFLLANVPAVAWPGSGVTVTLSGSVSGRWDLRAVSGGVTFAAVGD
jgi:hypothetical protein